MRYILHISVLCLLLTAAIEAQAGTGPVKNGGGNAHLYGKVIDGKTKKPLDYTAVSVFPAAKDSLVAGALTEGNGEFSFDHLPLGSYRVKVTFLGCKDFMMQVTLTASAPELDMGNIAMEQDAHTMTDVVVKGERATMTMNVDRKVFSVDKDISARGGNGMDVMKNIPGVAVDADGNVTLRNNQPQIYVDGKPTSLTLDLIPSDQIDRLEVITNASAKYEAAASGGILNVVLKHDRKPGYNGMISALAGTNSQYNATALANFHQHKFGFSLSFNTNGVRNPTAGYNNRTNLNQETQMPVSHIDQNTFRINKRAFQTIRAGIDYFISNRNTLSLTSNIVIGQFSNDINGDIRNLDANAVELNHGLNYNYEGVTRRTYTTTVDFKHTYPRAGKEYSISLSYERFKSGTAFYDTTEYYDPSGNRLAGADGVFKQNIPSGLHSDQITAQWDFSHPLRDSLKLEYGLRSYYKRTSSFANVSDYDYASNSFQPNADLSTNYLTNELINAGYVTLSQQIKKFSYQLGLRYEGYYFSGNLINKNQQFSYSYPTSAGRFYESFFPSFYLSQRLNDHNLFQLNMTRKTNRPSGGQINPNLEVIDKYDYTKGNPDLQPEFINQAELNYNFQHSKIDWLSSVYLRYIEHPLTGYSFDSAGIILASYINGKARLNYGWENTFKIMPTKNLSLLLNANLYYTSIKTYPDPVTNIEVSNSGLSMTAKAMISYKFPLGFAAQVNGSYEAPKPQPQGRTLPVYFFDISASKEFGIATISFTLSDVLNSHIHGTEYVTPDYIQAISKRREPRYAKLSVVFKFGKEDSGRKVKKAKKEKEEEQD